MSPTSEQMSRVARLVADGVIRVELTKLPLSQVQRAHELSESGHARGKIVLTLT